MDKKRIILIGSDHEAALELVFKRELESLGNLVRIIPVQNEFLQYYKKSICNKLLYKLGLSKISNKLQVFILQAIKEFDPNAVIVFKGMEVEPKTLMRIKAQGIKIYNYNPDNPFIFSGRGSGNSNVTNSIKYFDYYFSYAVDVVDQLNQKGIKSAVIPFGFDSKGFRYKPLKKENEVLKVCFLGNADKQRVKFINELADLGVEIDVYGENWKSFTLSNKINRNSAKYGQEFWDTLQQYAIQINLMRKHNLQTHNMRSFDIPGAGGIMLAPNTPDHAIFFKPNEEIFLFNNVSDAFQKIRDILKMTFTERCKIREAARKTALLKHCYAFRVNQLLEIIRTQ